MKARILIMKTTLVDKRKSFVKFYTGYKSKMNFRIIKVIVLAVFMFAFSLSASAEMREFQVREEYAVRDMNLAVSIENTWVNSNIGATVTWDEVMENVNKLTIDWINEGRKNPVYYYYFNPDKFQTKQ